MDYVLYISTPLNTLKTAPKISSLKLSRGRLCGGFLYFPAGPAGVLHFIAKVGTHQIIPFNIDENYRLNDCIVPLHLDIDLVLPPYTVECFTWNDSVANAHALTLVLFLDPWKKPRVKKSASVSNPDLPAGFMTGADRKS